MKYLLFIWFFPILVVGQQSIKESDIEIYTQLTLLSVDSTDVKEFENQITFLSQLANQYQLHEDYDWLTYTSDSGEYLIVNFSTGIDNILQIKDYKKTFEKDSLDDKFSKVLDSIKQLRVSLKKNYIKEMILPWSTVKQISVSEFPLATMVEYQIPTYKIDEYDMCLRALVKLLKDINYPYPLEGNRGSLGAYGKMTLVWFYDNRLEDMVGSLK